MNDFAIRVQELSKSYKIGEHQKGYKTIRDSLSTAASAPFRAFRARRAPTRKLETTTGANREFWALKDVSFEIKKGEVIGVIGRNGAGKSTLLKILSRITEPTTGYADIKGRIGSLLEVGTGFHPELTGRENVSLNGAILGMKRVEIGKKFDEIVAFAELEKFIDTPVKHYSTGMYLRLAFAVAAHLETEILLVDEVLAVGDATFQKKCIGKMGEVAGRGRTVLFVSHNMAAVQSLCSSGILLKDSKVHVQGDITNVVTAYLKSIEESSTQDLLLRTDRRGSGEAKLQRLTVAASDDDDSSTLATGRPAIFTFQLTKMLPGASCVFTVYDQFGQPIASFNSGIRSPEDVSSRALREKMVCRIDQLPLVPGRYRINASVYTGPQLQDHIEGAALFNVEAGNLNQRPVPKDTGYGKVCINHQWTTPV